MHTPKPTPTQRFDVQSRLKSSGYIMTDKSNLSGPNAANGDLRCLDRSICNSGGILTFYLKGLHPNYFFDDTSIKISSQKGRLFLAFGVNRKGGFNAGDQLFTERGSHSTNRLGASGAHTN